MIIEIFDQDSHGILLPTLKDFLQLLPLHSRELVWSILEAEGIRKDGGTINVSELEDRIYLWSELAEIADQFFQEINIIFVGCVDVKQIPRLGVDEDYYSPCEVVLEGLDTTLWRVYARKAEDLKEIRKTYKKIEVIKE